MQVIEIAESFRGLGILLIAKGFRPDVILANDTSFLTIRELGISEITVKRHRGQVMQKMKADSFAELVKMAARLRLPDVPKG